MRVFEANGSAHGSGWYAYDPQTATGVYAAACDVDGDGRDEVITAPGSGGGPHVRVFREDGSVVAEYMVYNPAFLGGVRVACADFDGDGRGDIVTAPGPGGGPHVKVFRLDGSMIGEFMAFDPAATMGVYVSAGRLSNGTPAVVVGAGEGAGPHVRLLRSNGVLISQYFVYQFGSAGVRPGIIGGSGGESYVSGGPGVAPYVLAKESDGDPMRGVLGR